jgi:hypothetical protein
MLISGKLVLLFMSAICLIFILIPLIIGIFLSQRILIIPTLLLIGYLIYIISLLKEEYNLCKKDHEYGIDEEIMEFCGFIPNETYIGHNFGIITKRDSFGLSMNFKGSNQYYNLTGKLPKLKMETGQFYKVQFLQKTLIAVAIKKIK